MGQKEIGRHDMDLATARGEHQALLARIAEGVG